MPKVKSDDDFKPYGSADLDQRLTFRERLIKRFAAHEWVRVINPDNEDYFWQYLPAHGESFEFDGGSAPMKSTYREPVEAWMLPSGETEVIIGENAYVMIEGLYKKLVSKGFIKNKGELSVGSPGRNFNWSDGKQQEDLIDKIFLGKESPSFGHATSKTPDTPRVTTPSGRLRTTPARA